MTVPKPTRTIPREHYLMSPRVVRIERTVKRHTLNWMRYATGSRPLRMFRSSFFSFSSSFFLQLFLLCVFSQKAGHLVSMGAKCFMLGFK